MWSRYWTYVHASLYSSRLNVLAIKQTTGIQNLDTGAYFNAKSPFPTAPSNNAPSLTTSTARRRGWMRLVAAKERVLGLLAEKRRALITRAVTRGLDPTVPPSATPASRGSARSRRIGRLNARDGCSRNAMNVPTRERRNSSQYRTSLV